MEFMHLEPVPFQTVKLNGFWKTRTDIAAQTTAPLCLDQCEKTDRVANFRRAAGWEKGGFKGIFFNDSDVYKVLEGVAYLLTGGAHPELEAQADAVIDAICAAQQPDGYLYTYYTLNGLENRWTDMGYHEAYCLGHMIEAAIAYCQATGKDKWLKASIRAVDHMMSIFGPGKRHWVTGHEEIELALVKLYRFTGEEKYLRFAEWLIDERGHGHLDSADFRRIGFRSDYCQDDVPARELRKVTGHAVRAMYYFSAMADVASLREDEALAAALERLWDNVSRNLYITGGIGQDASNEGFTRDDHLPNLTAYCETCAQIGMALWNHRMNLMTGDARYADLVEKELYNGVLSGISLDGKRFFYDNPLSSVGKYERVEWFGCSCCPTNLMRFIPSVGGYAYAVKEDCVYVNQYIAGSVRIERDGKRFAAETETGYPHNGKVRIKVTAADGFTSLRIRVPGWCEKYTLRRNGKLFRAEAGYACMPVASGDEIVLDLDLSVRFTRCRPEVKEDLGRVCVERGPLVYCAEEIDNPGIVREYFHAFASVDVKAPAAVEDKPDELGGIVRVRVGQTDLIPYYAWNNRGRGAMCVWLLEK